MNVLEKILEEINKTEEEYCSEEHSPMFCMGACSMAAYVKEIIHSHMDDLLDADEEEKSIICTLDKDGVLSEYDDTYDVVIHCTSKEDQDETVNIIKAANWIPVDERMPENNEYILLSFSNFSLPMVGRFENGAFYLGDEEDTCVSQDLFVNAWMELPDPYRPAEE